MRLSSVAITSNRSSPSSESAATTAAISDAGDGRLGAWEINPNDVARLERLGPVPGVDGGHGGASGSRGSGGIAC